MGFSLAFFQLEIAGDGTSSAQTTIQLAARIFGGGSWMAFSIGLSGGTMPPPSCIKNSGWSRFLAAWKIRVFYRRLLPRRTINSINISQVCEALCGFMRCFFVRSDNWHKIFTGCVTLALLNSNSDLTPRCRQQHTQHDESFNATKIICSTHVYRYMFPPIQSVQHRLHFGDFAIRLIHCPATGKFRTDGSISGLMVRAVWLVV